jgi:hypothetical protein
VPGRALPTPELGVATGWGHQFYSDRDADFVVATPYHLVRLLID